MKNIKFYLFLCCIQAALWAACSSPSRDIVLTGKIDLAEKLPYKLYLLKDKQEIPLTGDTLNATFTANLVCDTPYFVTLAGTVGTGDDCWGFSQPLYISQGRNIHITLQPGERMMQTTIDPGDKNNAALNAYTAYYLTKSRELWMTPPAQEQIGTYLKEFYTKADEISQKYRPTEEVGHFLKIQGYLEYMHGIKSLPLIYQQSSAQQAAKILTQEAPKPEKILDDPIALYFPNTIITIIDALEAETHQPEEQIRLLKQKYTQTAIQQHVILDIIQAYIMDYNYAINFEEGLKRLESMCTHLPFDTKQFVAEFRNKRFAAEGAPLPDARIEDQTGKQYKLSDFKGKYLYIDLWASWCVPCCAEVPYLQKLEKQVKNKEVEFISISIDKNKEDWTRRMARLHMTGHQYISVGDELSNMLNVKSIPHFLLYSKEGILMQYKAERPSSGDKLVKFLEQLK